MKIVYLFKLIQRKREGESMTHKRALICMYGIHKTLLNSDKIWRSHEIRV